MDRYEKEDNYNNYRYAVVCNFGGTITIILSYQPYWIHYRDNVFQIFNNEEQCKNNSSAHLININNFIMSFLTTEDYSAYEQATAFCNAVYNNDYVVLNSILDDEKEKIKSLKN